jgi:hypothetical protein
MIRGLFQWLLLSAAILLLLLDLFFIGRLANGILASLARGLGVSS